MAATTHSFYPASLIATANYIQIEDAVKAVEDEIQALGDFLYQPARLLILLF
jgi:hypothetical protein